MRFVIVDWAGACLPGVTSTANWSFRNRAPGHLSLMFGPHDPNEDSWINNKKYDIGIFSSPCIHDRAAQDCNQ
jgi:hypothetical protein